MTPEQLALAIRTALAEAVAAGDLSVDLPDEVRVERPKNREHGDWSSNAALAAAKAAKRNPRELATALSEHLAANPPAHVTKVEIAGPGFVDFHLADSWLHDIIGGVLDEGTSG